MHAFDVLGSPVRRRILTLLGGDRMSSGEIVEVVAGEFEISQPAVSQHLKILRDNGFATVAQEGRRRLYAVDPHCFHGVEEWIDHFRAFWDQHFDALETEIARGKRDRRRRSSGEIG